MCRVSFHIHLQYRGSYSVLSFSLSSKVQYVQNDHKMSFVFSSAV